MNRFLPSSSSRALVPLALAFAAAWAVFAIPSVAGAQVSDSERSAARELFRQGDELQRAGHFAEALDRFTRAQQVYAAPTNQLRIAECDAALGHLVESAEAYRAVARTTLEPGSPTAFQSAIDQAKAELEQVDPRVPRVVVQVSPSALTSPQLQIDGQSVPAALLGEPIPLDPGAHRIVVSAQGYAPTEQSVTLHERETRPVGLMLRSLPAAAPVPPPPPPPPPASSGTYAVAPPTAPPPPPPSQPSYFAPAPLPPAPRVSRFGFVAGGHFGAAALSGDAYSADSKTSVPISDVASGGYAFGGEAAFRFGRHWLVGFDVEHDVYGGTNGGDSFQNAGSTRAYSTMLQAKIAFVGNPDHVSFYGDVGLGARWFSYNVYNQDGTFLSGNTESGAEFSLGVGLWIPIGSSFRLLPRVSLDLGSVAGGQDELGDTIDYWHVAVMGGVSALYNLNF